MTHNDHGIVGFQRKSPDGSEAFVVLSHQGDHVRENYPVALPSGEWKEVFNSDSELYGGENVGNGGQTVSGHGASVNLPAGGTLVFKRV